MDYYAMLAIGIPLGLGIAVFGGAIGLGLAAQKSLETLGRQPEVRGFNLVLTVICLAFVEALVIYALVIAFQLIGDPYKEQVKELASVQKPAAVEKR